jgi:hypothetical protein
MVGEQQAGRGQDRLAQVWAASVGLGGTAAVLPPCWLCGT